MTISPQDTFDHIISSGALLYPWYDVVNVTGVDEGGDVLYDDWSADISVENPDDDDTTIVFTVSHQSIYDAMHLISTSCAFEPRPEGVSYRVIGEAGRFLDDPETADFDAAMADEVLQVMAFGSVVFG